MQKTEKWINVHIQIKVNKWTYEHMNKQLFLLLSQTTDHHPYCFSQVYMYLLTKIKIKDTKGEGTIDTTNKE